MDKQTKIQGKMKTFCVDVKEKETIINISIPPYNGHNNQRDCLFLFMTRFLFDVIRLSIERSIDKIMISIKRCKKLIGNLLVEFPQLNINSTLLVVRSISCVSDTFDLFKPHHVENNVHIFRKFNINLKRANNSKGAKKGEQTITIKIHL